jgi:hypothetical protein
MLVADRRRIDAETRAAREAGPDEDWNQAWAEGDEMTMDDAIDRAARALDRQLETIGAKAAGKVAV